MRRLRSSCLLSTVCLSGISSSKSIGSDNSSALFSSSTSSTTVSSASSTTCTASEAIPQRDLQQQQYHSNHQQQRFNVPPPPPHNTESQSLRRFKKSERVFIPNQNDWLLRPMFAIAIVASCLALSFQYYLDCECVSLKAKKKTMNEGH